MMTEHQEIARYRIEENIRTAERHAMLRESRRQSKRPRPGPRHQLATVLHRLADRVEPHQQRPRLSVIGR
jgi:hypothetical protein